MPNACVIPAPGGSDGGSERAGVAAPVAARGLQGGPDATGRDRRRPQPEWWGLPAAARGTLRRPSGPACTRCGVLADASRGPLAWLRAGPGAVPALAVEPL